MRKALVFIGLVSLLAAPASAGIRSDPADPYVKYVREHRGWHNVFRAKQDVWQACGGLEPVSVEITHTGGDVAAAIFTGTLYTPATLKVTCPSG